MPDEFDRYQSWRKIIEMPPAQGKDVAEQPRMFCIRCKEELLKVNGTTRTGWGHNGYADHDAAPIESCRFTEANRQIANTPWYPDAFQDAA